MQRLLLLITITSLTTAILKDIPNPKPVSEDSSDKSVNSNLVNSGMSGYFTQATGFPIEHPFNKYAGLPTVGMPTETPFFNPANALLRTGMPVEHFDNIYNIRFISPDTVYVPPAGTDLLSKIRKGLANKHKRK